MTRYSWLRSLLALTAGFVLAASALAQTAAGAYPARPVRMIIPFPPGGTLDTVGRALAQKLTEQLGQTVIVENRAGGNGVIGADAVAKAAEDGYTLLFNASTFVTAPMTMKSVPYDVMRDFAPISLVALAPLSVAISNKLGTADMRAFAAHARANPGKLNFAVGSVGSAGHLCTVRLEQALGVDVAIVPYRGTAPAFQDLIGGQIDGFIDPVLGSVQFHRAGQLKVVGVTSRARLPNLPEVPTVAETLQGFECNTWYGLWAPVKTPGDIVRRLNTEVNKALASDMRERFTQLGLVLTPGTIDDFVRFQRDDMARSQKIITDKNIRLE